MSVIVFAKLNWVLLQIRWSYRCLFFTMQKNKFWGDLPDITASTQILVHIRESPEMHSLMQVCGYSCRHSCWRASFLAVCLGGRPATYTIHIPYISCIYSMYNYIDIWRAVHNVKNPPANNNGCRLRGRKRHGRDCKLISRSQSPQFSCAPVGCTAASSKCPFSAPKGPFCPLST